MTRSFLPMRLLLALAVFVPAGPLLAGSAEMRVVWVDGKPQAEVRIQADGKPDLKEIVAPLELFDAQNKHMWSGPLKVPVTGEKTWTGRLPLAEVKDLNKLHHLHTQLLLPELDIDYTEEVYFSSEKDTLQSFGLRTQGVFPARKVFFSLELAAFKGTEFRDIPVTLNLRDGEDNQALNRQAAVRPASEAKRHVLDVTPDSGAIGPFKLEWSIESDGYSLFRNGSHQFAQPNALVPFSGFEHGDPAIWFAANSDQPGQQLTPAAYRSLELYGPGQEQLYYGDHLRDLSPRDNPRLSYDREVKHSGRQSLRIDYSSLLEAHAWSMQALPGKPLYLSLWVKGNDSKDQLVVYFEDNINYSNAAWQRRAQFSSAPVCTLNFNDWRKFRVPVLGYGLQVSGLKGSTDKIDAPIRITTFTVRPGPSAPGKPVEQRRIIWIDDLAAETQVPPADSLSLELQSSDPDGRLTENGVLHISGGNGTATELKKGKCTIVARDGGGQVVWSRTADLPAPAEGFANLDVSLEELAKKKPRGPIELEATWQDSSRAGLRISRGLSLKAAGQGGLVFDFEEPAIYSSFQVGKAGPAVGPSKAKIVAGGAEGSAHSLALPASPEGGSVLFHPALPGMVESVEMMIQGGDRPTTVQVWFIDSGYTGVWLRSYNVFWVEPIKVDWQGWKKVAVQPPPIPWNHGDKAKSFFKKPWYPLNLAVSARVAAGEPATEIRIDNIRVKTHLAEAEQLRAEVEFSNDFHVHAPGEPLRVLLYNFADAGKRLPLRYKLTSYQGHVARAGEVPVDLPAGGKHKVTLIDKLEPGIYDLEVKVEGQVDLKACIQVLNSKDYFGEDPSDLLTNPHLLRRLLGLTTERIYLDWDNTEPAPNLLHYHWFEEEVKKRREITQLPRDLVPLAERKTSAAAAVTMADTNVKAAMGRASLALNQVKPATDKITATKTMLTAAQADADRLDKVLELAKGNHTKAAEDALKAKTTQAEMLKAWQKLEEDVKTAKTALFNAEKGQKEAEAAGKEAEQKAKQAQDALTAANTKATQAEAAVKAAEKENIPKKIEDARTAFQAARKAQTDAGVLAEIAKKTLLGKQADLQTAQKKVETARAEAQALQTKSAAAKQASDQANTALQAADKQAQQFKTAMTQAEQQQQAGRKKVQDLEKTLAVDQQTLQARQKAVVDADAEVTQLTQAFETAGKNAELAAKALEDARSRYDFRLSPVVGFSTDWAGPEAAEGLEKGTFMRWIPNTRPGRQGRPCSTAARTTIAAFLLWGQELRRRVGRTPLTILSDHISLSTPSSCL
jgi:hypothetical protein